MDQRPISDSNDGAYWGSWRGRTRARVRRASQAISILGRFGFTWVLHELEILPRPRRRRVDEAVARLEMPERLRAALEELGPTAIKLGQVLASRADIVSEQYVRELRQLQDNVPASPPEEIMQVLREELGAEVGEVFAEFEPEPRASASIAQVHFARLQDGSPVAVKVQRRNVAEIMETDLDVILWAARQAERSITWAADNHVHEVAQEFARSLREELDFLVEGYNTDRLRSNLAEEENAYIPKIYWELSSRRVLVVEWVSGAKVGEAEQLREFLVDPPEAAKSLASLLIRQIMRDGYFHGDPHAGNVLFLGAAKVAFLDCGNAVAVDRAVRDNLVSLLLAALSNDSQEVTDHLLSLGAIGDRTDAKQLTNDIGRMLSYYSGYQSSAQAGLGNLLDQLLGMVLRHGVRMPPSLAAVAKSLIVAEGICLELDPKFDSQKLVREEVQQLIIQRLTPGRLLSDLIRIVRSTNRYAGLLPRQINQVLQRLQGGGVSVRIMHENLDQPLHRLDLMINRIAFALVVSAVIMSSTNLVTSSTNVAPIGRWMMVIYLAIGLVLGGWLLFSILRSGRL
ncbi:MAG: ABC1 kinase family protein [Armatimonadota bacterium]